MTPLSFDVMLPEMIAAGASDIHIRSDSKPMVRVHGDLRPMGDYPVQTAEEVKQLLESLLSPERRESLERQKSCDFSHAIEGVGRFRVNFFQERKGWGGVLRQIPQDIPQLHKLGAPASLLAFTDLPRGLVLVTGPTGSGKSTTLAAMLDVINRKRADHLLTVEDPIEFVHTPRRCVITQREVGEDTPSFSQALKDSLREDPDVILVGEMRDLETIRTAVLAAETGHLVFATLHTSSAPDTINRVISVFPEGEQQQIRQQLAGSLSGIVCQTLLPTADGSGRVAAHEVLISNTAVRAAIRDSKMASVRTTLQTQGAAGMQTLDKALIDLVTRGIVDEQVARSKSQDPKEFEQLLAAARSGKDLDLPPKVTQQDVVMDMRGEEPLAARPAPAAVGNKVPMPPAASTPRVPVTPALTGPRPMGSSSTPPPASPMPPRPPERGGPTPMGRPAGSPRPAILPMPMGDDDDELLLPERSDG